MENINHYLQYINILLLVSVVLGAAFQFFKLSPVLGYFVAGAVIAKFIEPGEGIHMFAEFGIVFLLFVIGLELTTRRLKSMSKLVFGFGFLQVLITAAVSGCAFYLYYGPNIQESFVVGIAFAMSSTAMVLQILQNANRQSTTVGRLSLAVLIFQDLAVVPLLVLVPLLSAGSEPSAFLAALALAMGKGLIVLVLIFTLGKMLVRPVFRAIVSLSSQELFLSTTIFLILSSAYLTEYFGLSMALGAFVAGLLLAETEYRDEVEHLVMPFKSLLLGLFFMTVGMSINFDTLLSSAHEIAILALSVIGIKALIIFVLARLFKFRRGSSIQAGLLLAQGGEFAFILLRLASDGKVISIGMAEKLMMTVTMTMAFTPLLSAIGDKIADRGAHQITSRNENQDVCNHVIVVGFGRFGKTLARILSVYNLYYLACDTSPAVVTEAQRNGYAVNKGDATKLETYDLMAAKSAIAAVVTMNNPITAAKVVKLLQANFPMLKVMVYVDNVTVTKNMDIADKNNIYAAELEGAIKLTSRIMMDHFDTNPEELVTKMHGIRKSQYSRLNDED